MICGQVIHLINSYQGRRGWCLVNLSSNISCMWLYPWQESSCISTWSASERGRRICGARSPQFTPQTRQTALPSSRSSGRARWLLRCPLVSVSQSWHCRDLNYFLPQGRSSYCCSPCLVQSPNWWHIFRLL